MHVLCDRVKQYMSCLMTKQRKWLCAQRRLRSARASAQSDQSLRCALNGLLRTQAFFMPTAKTLIRLGGCPGWSESSLGAHIILLVLSWDGSYIDWDYQVLLNSYLRMHCLVSLYGNHIKKWKKNRTYIKKWKQYSNCSISKGYLFISHTIL